MPCALCLEPFFPATSIEYRASSIEHPASSIQYRASIIQPPETRDQHAASMNITCHKCLHYYVTWDQHFPHGCRIMGFKSRPMPMFEVRRTMHGKDCLFFEVKKTKNPPPNFKNRQ
jgi:hypothetical protein